LPEVAFIGVIGSRRTHETGSSGSRELSDDELARMSSPIHHHHLAHDNPTGH